MPFAAETLLFPPGRIVTRSALKWSGPSTTLGSLVAAITVRVIVDGGGGVCAAAERAARTSVAHNTSPVVQNRMGASLICECNHAPAPTGDAFAGRHRAPWTQLSASIGGLMQIEIKSGEWDASAPGQRCLH